MAAAVLPWTIFALQSKGGRRLYLRYTDKTMADTPGRLEFSEKEVLSPYAKFQAEPATDGCEGFVHIKCLYINKYLRRASPSHWWILAAADQPNEDRNSWECTLFHPQLVRHEGQNAVVRLLHVQLGHYAVSFSVDADLNETLYANSGNPDAYDLDMCTVIDLERIELPNPFVLKSNDNGGYLRCLLDDQESNNHEILQFSEPDRSSRFAKFYLEQPNSSDHRDHYYVHIKCLCNNKYLRRMDSNGLLILAVADQPDEDKSSWTCTLFKPEHVEPPGKNTPDKVLCRIRHGQTDLYTRPFVDSRSELQLGDKDPDLEEVDAYTAMPCSLL